jgi:hypothetical protein
VCSLVDADDSAKSVKFCSWCGRWLCDSCRPDYLKRFAAAKKAARMTIGRLFGAIREGA